MGYKIKKNSNDSFDVIEYITEFNEEKIIRTFTSNIDAKNMKKFLNLGGGFAGFTPDFFLLKFVSN